MKSSNSSNSSYSDDGSGNDGGTRSNELFDMYYGRGNGLESKPGNQNYRRLINENRPIYKHLKNNDEKNQIAYKIINNIHENGGTFYHKPKNDEWEIVPTEKVLEKVKQALRDATSKRIRREEERNVILRYSKQKIAYGVDKKTAKRECSGDDEDAVEQQQDTARKKKTSPIQKTFGLVKNLLKVDEESDSPQSFKLDDAELDSLNQDHSPNSNEQHLPSSDKTRSYSDETRILADTMHRMLHEDEKKRKGKESGRKDSSDDDITSSLDSIHLNASNNKITDKKR